MGAVYEAEQADGRVTALKVLNVDLGQLDARERFFREGRSAAAVNHPNTVYVYRAEEIDGVPAICMELVPHGTLEQLVESRGPLPVRQALSFAMDMIEGLAAAHDVGLLHRDVKPSNCFLAEDGTLKVGDFGLSKPSSADDQMRLTQTGVFMGTPVYSSPEQLLGEALDARSDIYAVGLTLYFALTGTLPYASGSMMQVIASVVNGAPAPIMARRPDLPPAVAAVVMKAMARHAAERFQSYDEFRDAVAALRDVEHEPARPAERVRAWAIDAIVTSLLLFGVVQGLEALGVSTNHDPNGPDTLTDCVFLLISLLVIGVPEGLRGASLGKWLLGLRVVGPSGGPPGLARSFARSLLLWTFFGVSDLFAWIFHNEGISAVAGIASRLGLFVTVRSGTGWRTVYDRVTGTRVVKAAPPQMRRRRGSVSAQAPERLDSRERRGPYVIVPERPSPLHCVTGWDSALGREVWIASSTASAPTESRRAVTRPTRARWVGAGGEGEARWNSYGAVGGESLASRLERSVQWTEAQGWIVDLCDELIAAAADGSLAATPPLDALWIGGNG